MIIATRTLKLRRKEDIDLEVPIRLYLPEQSGERAWTSKFEIEWPDRTISVPVGGVDAVQTIFSALQIIGAFIYSSEYHESGDLFLETPGNGYGFPVTPDLRDMLIGDDAKFV
jgi:hypothetical protein